MPVGWCTKRKIGDLVSRFSTDVEITRLGVDALLAVFISRPLSVLKHHEPESILSCPCVQATLRLHLCGVADCGGDRVPSASKSTAVSGCLPGYNAYRIARPSSGWRSRRARPRVERGRALTRGRRDPGVAPRSPRRTWGMEPSIRRVDVLESRPAGDEGTRSPGGCRATGSRRGACRRKGDRRWTGRPDTHGRVTRDWRTAT